MNLTLLKFPKGKVLDATLDLIKQLSWEGKKRPAIKFAAVKILENTGIQNGRHRKQVAIALADWVFDNIKYFNDPHRTETLQTPEKTIELGYGDCDDFAILLAALLMSVGIPARFVIEGITGPEHIYVEALTPEGWTGLDPAAGPDDPPPEMLKVFKKSGFTGEKNMIGQLPKQTGHAFSPYATGALGNGGEDLYYGVSGIGAYGKRSRDPITQLGTALEREAGGIPLLITAIQTTAGKEPEADVLFLPAINPADISHYAADMKKGIIYPVLKKYSRAAGDLSLMGYQQMANFEQFGELGFSLAVFIPKVFKAVKKKVVKVAKKLRHPIRSIKKYRSPEAAAQRDVFKAMRKSKLSPKTPRGTTSILEQFKMGGIDDLTALLQTADIAKNEGGLTEEEWALIQAQIQAGDIDGAEQTGGNLAPVYFGKTEEAIPPWALPLGIAAGAFIAYKKGWI